MDWFDKRLQNAFGQLFNVPVHKNWLSLTTPFYYRSQLQHWWYNAAVSREIKALLSAKGQIYTFKDHEGSRISGFGIKNVHRFGRANYLAPVSTLKYELRYADQCRLESLMIENWSTIRDMILVDSPRYE